MRFEIKKIISGILVLFLILGVGFYLSRPRTIYGNPTGDIPFEMPKEIDGYVAERLLFCTNEQCAHTFREGDLVSKTNGIKTVSTNCSVCGSPLDPISIGEKKLLPTHTPIFRSEYNREGSVPVQATLVFSGIERRSIHRPQVCLVAQGNKITNEYTKEIKVGWKESVKVRVLEIQQAYGEEDGTKTLVSAIYAYWLFNPEHETDSHWNRFIHMAFDNAFRNYRPRWGYLSITIVRDPNNPTAWEQQLDEFVRLFYPHITDIRQKLDEQRDIKTVIQGRSSELNTYSGKTGFVTENPTIKSDDASATNSIPTTVTP